ncbi:MAG TPA: cupin domain-containing protein [Solirubrobacteraceae bacterium]|jgi:quercetin dioxygenase-like cupin family protein|nr:cupin domain-containing protein [Solirubrobacteraceae bacterium]
MAYDVRRIVTGHDDEGHAVVRSIDTLRSRVVADGYEPVEIWCANGLPAENSEDARSDGTPGERDSRAMLRFGELGPGHLSPMHRSRSLDYAILLSGECELLLDDGSATLVRAGDVVIQRGTNHAWRNSSSEPARFAWILVDAQPVRIGDEVLPEVMPGDHDVLADWQPNAI